MDEMFKKLVHARNGKEIEELFSKLSFYIKISPLKASKKRELFRKVKKVIAEKTLYTQ